MEAPPCRLAMCGVPPEMPSRSGCNVNPALLLRCHPVPSQSGRRCGRLPLLLLRGQSRWHWSQCLRAVLPSRVSDDIPDASTSSVLPLTIVSGISLTVVMLGMHRRLGRLLLAVARLPCLIETASVTGVAVTSGAIRRLLRPLAPLKDTTETEVRTVSSMLRGDSPGEG